MCINSQLVLNLLVFVGMVYLDALDVNSHNYDLQMCSEVMFTVYVIKAETDHVCETKGN